MANAEHLALLERGVEEWNRWRREYPEIQPNLRDAALDGANLRDANLSQADLSGINLSQANLWNADLRQSNLLGAVLYEACLFYANLSLAHISSTDLSLAQMFRTGLNDLDLRHAEGLETVQHYGPSDVGIQTIARSHGEIPAVFLRRAGVPESFLRYVRSLACQPLDGHSCFISYTSQDYPFARLLHLVLQQYGVRCWLVPHDLKDEGPPQPRVEESIGYEKFLVVLSEHSVGHPWVEQEVERALAQERTVCRQVLFLVGLDRAVLESDEDRFASLRSARTISDFTHWKTSIRFQNSAIRLVHALKAKTVHSSYQTSAATSLEEDMGLVQVVGPARF